eukprot:10378830-Alexandrium_andersonii.AAC.1
MPRGIVQRRCRALVATTATNTSPEMEQGPSSTAREPTCRPDDNGRNGGRSVSARGGLHIR